MKKILGLDLGTTSIGWAFVHEAKENHEVSKIIKTGVRVIPLSTEEQQDFEKGNPITLNADRTLKRGARRNLQRYKLRRKSLVDILKRIHFIDDASTLTEDGENTTHQLYELRSKAATTQIDKIEFARVLLTINKKRGYKSSRKAKGTEEGALIDGMAIAKQLIKQNITPGQFSLALLEKGKNKLPDYYGSDLENEFDRIWKTQSQFHPSLTEIHRDELKHKNRTATKQYFEKQIGTELAENKGKNKKIQLYQWRSEAISTKLSLEIIALLLTEINGQINQSSSYLANISDRSKALYFQELTIGQYQYKILKKDPHTSLKNQVFYRQDYIDEFEKIWATQSQYYPELNTELKKEVKNTIIFYQRPLKSQKGLVSSCELESRERTIIKNGKPCKKRTGPKVAPRSSPIFQMAKVWLSLNNLRITNENTSEEFILDDELRNLFFNELQFVKHLTTTEILKILKRESKLETKGWKTNLEKIEGNLTQTHLFGAYQEIITNAGFPELAKNADSEEKRIYIERYFKELGISPHILQIDFSLTDNDFSQQPAYEFWHLLYSFEGDKSTTGEASLLQKLEEKYGFTKEQAQLLTSISFSDNYSHLSVKAIRKLYPHLEDGYMYSEACTKAGYNHSKSFTKEEIETRTLLEKLEILPKNALRNPVVEKILNQMIHIVNAIIAHPEMGRPDIIRVEMARKLKNNAKKRKEVQTLISRATTENEKDRAYLHKEIGLKHVSRKDLIKYKLYKELQPLGHKTPYSGTYIELKDLFFSNEFDVEHIIPQSVVFDDSLSNKTLELRSVNLEKGNQTAIDFCIQKGWETDFRQRILELQKSRSISNSKYRKLLQTKDTITDDFTNRDLNNTAYISKKATEILFQVCNDIKPTNGKITDRLRNDWGLIDVLKELNWKKYEALGLTHTITNKEGKELKRITDWTKRNDHRHHAMDAIAIAFTREEFVQYLNNLHAKSDKNGVIYAIEQKHLYRNKHNNLKFKPPFPEIRQEVLKQLSGILVSFKAKNKVTTRNTNTIKTKGGTVKKTALTPRGQLHKETIYGTSKIPQISYTKVNGSFDLEKINTVSSPKYKEALLKRLQAFEDNPKKAFTGKNTLSKNPITLPNGIDIVPEKVKCVSIVTQFTIRKPIDPTLKIDKVVDKGIQRILLERLKKFNNKPKEAFINLDKDPIWVNEKAGIKLKRVTITGVSSALPLHEAKDHHGALLVDKNNQAIPVDYVSTGNNHHVAIYEDENGQLYDDIVSFYKAVIRKSNNYPIVNTTNEQNFPLKFSIKQNEMFVRIDDDFDITDLKSNTIEATTKLSKRMFRAQKISRISYGNSVVRDYVFRHHLDTTTDSNKKLKDHTWFALKSLEGIKSLIKVRVNHLGEIVDAGEY